MPSTQAAPLAQPAAPTALLPGIPFDGDFVIANLTPTLGWTDVGADYYSVAISKDPYGSSNIIYNPQNVFGTSVTVPSGVLSQGTRYRWNLRGHNASGPSPFSNTLYFQTPIVDATIDWHSPSPHQNVEVGQDVQLGVAFTNTGTISWRFIAGVTVWDGPPGDPSRQVVGNYNQTAVRDIAPGEQYIAAFTHPVNSVGDYWVQFGVWKQQPFIIDNLLGKQPDPSQNLFSGVAPLSFLSVSPTSGLSASGPQGGSFSPSSQLYTLTNIGGSGLSWSASTDQPWVGVSHVLGSLAPGDFSNVTVSLNSSADSLPPGTHTATVFFTNNTDGQGNTTRTVTLNVTAPSLNNLTISCDGSGSVSPQACNTTQSYNPGSQVNLGANPDSGWVFNGWSGDCSGTGSCQLTMDTDKNVTAAFIQDQSPFASLFFSPGTITLQEGETVWIDLMVDTGPDAVNAVAAYFSYPEDKLEALGLDTSESVIGGTLAEAYAASGLVEIAGGDPTPGFSGVHKVARIGFEAKASSGTSTLTFNSESAVLLDVGNLDVLDLSSSGQLEINFTSPSTGGLLVTPAGGLSSSGQEGGPFSPSSQQYTVANTGSTGIDWTLSKTQNWVDPFSVSGFISAGDSDTVTISINSNANILSTGTYTDTVTFTNTTNGIGNTTRNVNLTVEPQRIDLPAWTCDQESSLRSIEGITLSSIQFINTSSLPLQIHWLDYQGQRRLWHTLQNGQSYIQGTYLTQPWLVSDLTGECLGIYQPTQTPGKVTITMALDAGQNQTVSEGESVNLDPASFSGASGLGPYAAEVAWGDSPPLLDQKQENLNGCSAAFGLYGDQWHAMSFRPQQNSLSRVELLLNLGSGSNISESISVGLRSDLAGRDIVNNTRTLPLTTSPTWASFEFGDIPLTPGQEYFLVMSSPTSTPSDNVGLWYSCSGTDLYTSGHTWISVNAGSNWSAQPVHADLAFQTFALQFELADVNESGGAGTVSASHVYADDGQYNATVCVNDGSSVTSCDRLKVNVNNVPPSVNAGADQPLNVGDTVSLSPAAFNDKGTLDTHTATVNWDDGTPLENGIVSENPFGPPGALTGADGTVSANHIYNSHGNYNVEVCVIDDDNGRGCDSFSVAVADPSIVDPIVDILTDEQDGSCSDGDCSVRDAIEIANSNGLSDVITFAVTGVIQLTLGTLELSEDSTTIDVSATGQNITLDGSLLTGTDILTLSSNSNTIQGLTISGAPNGGNGIFIFGDNNLVGGDSTAGEGNIIKNNTGNGVYIIGANNEIKGNFIGVEADGSTAAGNNENGVYLDSSNNIIGGSGTGEGNVISGNGSNGIYGYLSDDNIIKGNKIGVSSDGNTAVPNAFDGVDFEGGRNNVIGGPNTSDGNIISGNSNNGIRLDPEGIISDAANEVKGNYIGTNGDGTLAIPNGGNGISNNEIGGNFIGGANPGDGNVISGNSANGIYFYDSSSRRNEVYGNRIGTNASGDAAIPNGGDGIKMEGGWQNEIGGLGVGESNLISGNQGNGVVVEGAVAYNNVINNSIGTNLNGDAALPNGGSGVIIIGRDNSNFVEDNLISGNLSHGVEISGGFNTAGNSVSNNIIGSDRNLVTSIPNSGYGVLISNSDDNEIFSNIIAYNGSDGISIVSGIGNSLINNSTFLNGGLGIDLNDDGPTPNDDPGISSSDDDSGSNNLQNYPSITVSELNGSELSLTYIVPSNPSNSAYPLSIAFYKADADGEEGETLIYTDTYVMSEAESEKVVIFLPITTISSGDLIVSTATDSDDNTSEFSPSALVINQHMCNGLVPTKIGTDGDDLIVGTPGDDVLVGLDGHDTIIGGDGNDVICGGDGQDGLFGGDGNDVIYGGRGGDGIFGGFGDDTLFGDDDSDTIDGGWDNDIMNGGSGDDAILGKNGRDEAICGGGNDYFNGGGQNDRTHPSCEINVNVP